LQVTSIIILPDLKGLIVVRDDSEQVGRITEDGNPVFNYKSWQELKKIKYTGNLKKQPEVKKNSQIIIC